MLTIKIDDPDLERSIRQAYGDNSRLLVDAFVEFLRQQRVREDIGVSIEQLDSGSSIPLAQVMAEIRRKFNACRSSSIHGGA